MSTVDEVELEARLAAVRDGPWARRASAARSPLASSTAAYDFTQPASYLSAKSRLSGPLVGSGLRITFPMWGNQNAPSTDEQRQARDSFEDAYTYYQLMDLAIDTGYLPAKRILAPVSLHLSEIIRPLLRTVSFGGTAATSYIGHEFETEQFLTQRSEPTNPDCAGHFLSFLATDHALNRNPLSVAWQRFLAEGAEEHAPFYAFLNSNEVAKSRRQQTLILGAQSSVVQLADFLVALPESLQTRFTYLYGSSLRRFFGRRQERPGFSLEPWTNVAESWSTVLGNWLDKRGRAATVSYSSLAVPSLYYEALGVLKPVWDKAQASLAQQEAALTK